MKVTSLVISTLFSGDTKAIESRVDIDNVFANMLVVPAFKDTFLLELTRNLIALKNEGATITIIPTIDYSDDHAATWELLDYRSQHALVKLMKEGKKIGAIQELRAQTRMGLKEAKKFVCSQWFLEKVPL